MKARLLAPMLLVAAFAGGCGGGGGSATLTPNDVATVGSLHITKQRFEDQLSVARVNLKAQGQKFPKPGTSEYETLKANVLAVLLQAAARELKAEKLGIEVTGAEINRRLRQVKKQYFGGSEQKYQAQLRKQGLTDAEVHALVKTQLISERVAEKITNDVTVSDKDVHEYYQAHLGDYVQPTRKVLEILVGKDKKELAQQLYRQLKGGADFGKLAKQYSQDPGSKNIGGKFTARKGKDVPDFDRVAFSIKTGELAPPFETPEYGWFIVEAVSDVRQVKTQEKAVAAAIRAQLLEEKQKQAMTEWLQDAAESVCKNNQITYQVGYGPNPDPCLQFTSTTFTDTGP
jgi:parvulin-like peptidyl-prolyl isomerase